MSILLWLSLSPRCFTVNVFAVGNSVTGIELSELPVAGEHLAIASGIPGGFSMRSEPEVCRVCWNCRGEWRIHVGMKSSD